MDHLEIGLSVVNWIGLAQDRYSSCELGNEPSGSIKCWESTKWLHILWPIEWYSAPQLHAPVIPLEGARDRHYIGAVWAQQLVSRLEKEETSRPAALPAVFSSWPSRYLPQRDNSFGYEYHQWLLIGVPEGFRLVVQRTQQLGAPR
jgi:hypothetical protein